MQKKTTLVTVAAIAALFLFGCNESDQKSGEAATAAQKIDSGEIARKFISSRRTARTDASARATAGDTTLRLDPPEVAWELVTKYRQNYENTPSMGEGESAIRGFNISEETLKLICANDKIKSLYIAFGKDDEGKPVLLVLGKDSEGRLMENDESHANFDYTTGCPSDCP